MKKILLLVLAGLFCSHLTHAQEKNYQISITIKGMENKIGLLAYYYADKKYLKDTLYFNEKGTAEIKGKKNIPDGVYLLAFPSMRYQSFDILLKETAFTMKTDTLDFIRHATFKNTKENQQMFDDMKFMTERGVKMDSLRKQQSGTAKNSPQFEAISEQMKKISDDILQHRKAIIAQYPSTFYTRLLKAMTEIEVPDGERKPDGSLIDTFHQYHYIQQHYFDAIDFADSGYIRSPIFLSKVKNYFSSYVHPHPDSIIVAVDKVIEKSRVNKEMFQYLLFELFNQYAKSEIMGHDAIYAHIAEKYYLSGDVWWVEEKTLKDIRERVEALKPTLIGKYAPNFTVQDSLGKNQTFHDFLSKYDYTILIFWNSDCGHCQQEIPHLKQVYTDSLKALNIGVFAVSTEQTDSSFRAFAAQKCAADWVTCADMRGVSSFRREYDVTATPKLYLIDKNRKILAKKIPLEKIAEFIRMTKE